MRIISLNQNLAITYTIKHLVLPWEPLSLLQLQTRLCIITRDIIEKHSRYITLYKHFIDDIFVIWDGPYKNLLEFLNAINTKDEHIKITYEISESKISFLDLLLFKDSAFKTLQYSTFQKPLNMSYFTPLATKKLLLKASLCVMPEIALIFTHLMKHVCYSGSVYVLGDTLLSFCYPFSGRFIIATGRNDSLSLIGYLDTDM